MIMYVNVKMYNNYYNDEIISCTKIYLPSIHYSLASCLLAEEVFHTGSVPCKYTLSGLAKDTIHGSRLQPLAGDGSSCFPSVVHSLTPVKLFVYDQSFRRGEGVGTGFCLGMNTARLADLECMVAKVAVQPHLAPVRNVEIQHDVKGIE